MPAFRKKPVVISAQQITAKDDNTTQQIEKWFIGAVIKGEIEQLPGNKTTVKTFDGVLTCGVGDYIIQGAQGELYHCKKEIFEQTYERVS